MKKNQLLIDAVNQRRRQHSRRLEDLEKIKFQQDAKTGLTHFDKVREIHLRSQDEIDKIKVDYEKNLMRLMHLAQTTQSQAL